MFKSLLPRMQIIIRFDGGCNNNPGSGGSGTVIYKNGKIFAELAKYFDHTTNNEAEYNGLIDGLEFLTTQYENPSEIESVKIEGDSQLVVKQVRGEWKVKAENLKPLHQRAQDLFKKLNNVEISHIPRKLNTAADELSNEVRIDKKSILRVYK